MRPRGRTRVLSSLLESHCHLLLFSPTCASDNKEVIVSPRDASCMSGEKSENWITLPTCERPNLVPSLIGPGCCRKILGNLDVYALVEGRVPVLSACSIEGMTICLGSFPSCCAERIKSKLIGCNRMKDSLFSVMKTIVNRNNTEKDTSLERCTKYSNNNNNNNNSNNNNN